MANLETIGRTIINVENLQEDILSLIIRAEEKGYKLTQTDLTNGLRGSFCRAFVTPESGRKWRGLPNAAYLLSIVEELGFTVTRGRTTYISL